VASASLPGANILAATVTASAPADTQVRIRHRGESGRPSGKSWNRKIPMSPTLTIQIHESRAFA